MQVLILTQSYTPHRICSWQDCLTEFYTGKVEILETYDEVIHHSGVKMPAVARLLKSVSRMKKGVKFSRINVYSRDDFTCMYCGEKMPSMKHLNRDHVLPRVQGGKTEWTNIVTSCIKCNTKKGARTPEQAKMRLLRAPVRPKTLPIAQPMIALKTVPEQWLPYLTQQS